MTINRDTVDEGYRMFEEGMYFSVFYSFCFVNDILTYEKFRTNSSTKST